MQMLSAFITHTHTSSYNILYLLLINETLPSSKRGKYHVSRQCIYKIIKLIARQQVLINKNLDITPDIFMNKCVICFEIEWHLKISMFTFEFTFSDLFTRSRLLLSHLYPCNISFKLY